MGTWGSVGGGNGVFVFTSVPTKLGTIGVMSDVKADCYKPVNATYYGAVNTRDDFSVLQSTTNASELYVKDTRFTSIADFKAANVGKLLYYPFATLPDPIILTAEDLVLLLGNNNVWANTGDSELTYAADIKLYIDKKLAEG
jgi:hypothetical protein